MKKRVFTWVLVSLVALLVVFGILRMRYGNKLFYKNVFTDTEKHVSFAYPRDWTILTGGTNPYLVATVTSPDIKEYTPSFNVTREEISADMSLDIYIEQTMKQLKQVIGDFQQEKISTVTIAGQSARKVVFHGQYLGKVFSWEQIYTLKDHNIYVMTYLAPSDSFSEKRAEIETSFSTFSFN